MLAQIKGRLVKKQPGKILLETGAFTFEINVPFNLAEKLPPVGEEAKLFTSLKIRNDALELYGFLSASARDLFEKLQSISRLGPKLALNILAVFEPEELARVVAENDAKTLAKVPGIGPRRAERLCVEFRARLGLKPSPPSPLFQEALSALLNLGFSRDEAQEALEKVFQEGKDLSEIVKNALKRLSLDGTP